MSRRALISVMPACAGLLLAFPAWAGPPAICQRIDIGDAKSLPWRTGSEYNLTDPAYDVSRLVTDTLALLGPATPVKVRMETMRRAALYSAKDSRLAYDLAARLMARALDSESEGRRDRMAWFDAGYFVETLDQAVLVYKWDMLSPAEKEAWTLRKEMGGIDGVRWVRKAMAMGGESADFRDALSKINLELKDEVNRAAR